MFTAQFVAPQIVHFSPTGKLSVALGGTVRGKTFLPQRHPRAQAETEVHPAVAGYQAGFPFCSPCAQGYCLSASWPHFRAQPAFPLRGAKGCSCPTCVFKPETATTLLLHPSLPFSLGPGDHSAFLQAFLHLQVCFWKPISITGSACQEAAPPTQEVTWGPESPKLLG